ncbi:MAG: methyltransferase domain-containing protein [Hamadaea sp.]|nr:methyltransferase domain-containing protein [Hamadaea sp.]
MAPLSDDQQTPFDAHERRQWRGRAADYERSFAKLCGGAAAALVDAAGATHGVRLLDVGTGTGTVAALAADTGAQVSAVDAEQSMVEHTRARVPAADVQPAVLPRLPFPDAAFDAVTANFVLNHVGRPTAAVAELRRVTRPGGRIAVTVWPYPQPPLQRLWSDALDLSGVARPQGLPSVASADNFDRTEDGLAGLLEAAGLAHVSCRTLAWDHVTDLDEWWSGPAAGIGAFGQLLAALPAADVARVRSAFERVAQPFTGPGGRLAVPTAALLAVGIA